MHNRTNLRNISHLRESIAIMKCGMGTRSNVKRNYEIQDHPLLQHIGQLAAETVGLRLLVVHPTQSGWSHFYGDKHTELQPAFCKLIHSSSEGSKHCRMCHMLMSVAACSGGKPTLQRCHAGAHVLVCPAADASSEAVAIISSCIFADPQRWCETATKGEALGIDRDQLRKAFSDLPKISDQKRRQLESFMQAMSLAIQTIQTLDMQKKQVTHLEQRDHAQADIEYFLEQTEWTKNSHEANRSVPLLVRVVCELVRQRPDLPLNVKELAAAAGITPNHLTSLFRRWTGQTFTACLIDQRMARAQHLLQRNARLNISEIARLVGYEDSGYFARRFRQHTGFSPRQWRDRLHTV